MELLQAETRMVSLFLFVVAELLDLKPVSNLEFRKVSEMEMWAGCVATC